MSPASKTEEAAALWLLRRGGEGWSDADQAELDGWLNEASENRVAFWRLEYGWEKADRLAALGKKAAPARRPARIGARVWLPLAAAVAACAVIAGLTVPDLLGPRAYTTAVGGQQTVPLSDGTRVELNTGTKLRVAVNNKARAVWLDKGEAYFEVARDPSRPFVVHAGPRRITVLGTKFSVRREGDRVEVAVVEGKVKVEQAAPTQPTPPAFVTRGDLIVAEGDSNLLAVKSVQRVNEELSWRHGRLTFDQVTLSEAVSEFNRYNHKQLVITDPQAATLRIGGSFEAGNIEAFTRLLQRGFSLKIEEDGDLVKISS
jgi:transmembrane sensor